MGRAQRPRNANLPIGAPKTQPWTTTKPKTGDRSARLLVNLTLFPYLHGFKQKASGSKHHRIQIGTKFSAIKNKIQSGYNLRDHDHNRRAALPLADEKHELSHLYEAKSKTWARRAQAAASITRPALSFAPSSKSSSQSLGERIYDGARGSAGFPLRILRVSEIPRERQSPIGGVKERIQENGAPVAQPRISPHFESST